MIKATKTKRTESTHNKEEKNFSARIRKTTTYILIFLMVWYLNFSYRFWPSWIFSLKIKYRQRKRWKCMKTKMNRIEIDNIPTEKLAESSDSRESGSQRKYHSSIFYMQKNHNRSKSLMRFFFFNDLAWYFSNKNIQCALRICIHEMKPYVHVKSSKFQFSTTPAYFSLNFQWKKISSD